MRWGASSTDGRARLSPSALLMPVAFAAMRTYRFLDFFRVGAPLTVVVYLLAILLVPRVWPL
jgi:di/tricarboxylate transporter